MPNRFGFLNEKDLAEMIILSYTANHSAGMVNWQQSRIRSGFKHNKKIIDNELP